MMRGKPGLTASTANMKKQGSMLQTSKRDNVVVDEAQIKNFSANRATIDGWKGPTRSERLVLPEIVRKKGPTKRAAPQPRRNSSPTGSEIMAPANPKRLSRKDGKAVTVEDFLADVALIKDG